MPDAESRCLTLAHRIDSRIPDSKPRHRTRQPRVRLVQTPSPSTAERAIPDRRELGWWVLYSISARLPDSGVGMLLSRSGLVRVVRLYGCYLVQGGYGGVVFARSGERRRRDREAVITPCGCGCGDEYECSRIQDDV